MVRSRWFCRYHLLAVGISVYLACSTYYFIQYHDISIVPVNDGISKGHNQWRFVAHKYRFINGELRMFGYFLNDGSSMAFLRVQNISVNMENVMNIHSKLISKPDVKKSNSVRQKQLDQIKKFFSFAQNVADVNCSALFGGEEEEQRKATKLMLRSRRMKSTEMYMNMTKSCASFKRSRRYITNTLTKEEEEFPIAYSIVAYKDVEQTERLLRAIYRPHHKYCIHIDKKAKNDYRQAIQSIADCFNNVFLSSRSVDVKWGTFTVLEADLVCMEDLWKYKKWKYFINLTGQEFPLRTNYELMRILKVYNGANDVEGTIKRANKGRWNKAGKPPHGIRPVKGSVHIAVNRDLVDYILHNETAKDFLDWVKLTPFPEETFVSTLNHNPQLGIPGSYKGEPETNALKPFLIRFKNWGYGKVVDWPCKGKRVRAICIFGIGDLPLLTSRPEMFANKFYRDYQPYTLDCMEELIYNRTRDEYIKKMIFDTKFYESLDFVTNKV